MNIRQEKFIYARIKDYEKRLSEVEKVLNIRSNEELQLQEQAGEDEHREELNRA